MGRKDWEKERVRDWESSGDLGREKKGNRDLEREIGEAKLGLKDVRIEIEGATFVERKGERRYSEIEQIVRKRN